MISSEENTKQDNQNLHVSVLFNEVIDGLAFRPGDIFLDGTLGGGGHSLGVCNLFNKQIEIIGLDVEEEAILRSTKRFSGKNCNFHFERSNFSDFDFVLKKIGVNSLDKVLLDLGVSSFHFDISGRGFSFLRDEPLLMTLTDQITKETLTAFDVVNFFSEKSLADIFYGYGEELNSRRIAKAICQERKNKEIKTTFDLVKIIESVTPRRNQKIHPATKVFQAIRIAVNNELGKLEDSLDKFLNYLNPKGRIAIISFHSLEDRIVKNKFKKWSSDGLGDILTKKPLTPKDEELFLNKRSRSAKLRIFEKK